jgi:hypothetical protein
MPTKIDEDFMCLEINGTILGTATKQTDDRWKVSDWPQLVDRNRAITALTITELLDSGHDSNDLIVRALRDELR